jgi:hypothetical protein
MQLFRTRIDGRPSRALGRVPVPVRLRTFGPPVGSEPKGVGESLPASRQRPWPRSRAVAHPAGSPESRTPRAADRRRAEAQRAARPQSSFPRLAGPPAGTSAACIAAVPWLGLNARTGRSVPWLRAFERALQIGLATVGVLPLDQRHSSASGRGKRRLASPRDQWTVRRSRKPLIDLRSICCRSSVFGRTSRSAIKCHVTDSRPVGKCSPLHRGSIGLGGASNMYVREWVRVGCRRCPRERRANRKRSGRQHHLLCDRPGSADQQRQAVGLRSALCGHHHRRSRQLGLA